MGRAGRGPRSAEQRRPRPPRCTAGREWGAPVTHRRAGGLPGLRGSEGVKAGRGPRRSPSPPHTVPASQCTSLPESGPHQGVPRGPPKAQRDRTEARQRPRDTAGHSGSCPRMGHGPPPGLSVCPPRRHWASGRVLGEPPWPGWAGLGGPKVSEECSRVMTPRDTLCTVAAGSPCVPLPVNGPNPTQGDIGPHGHTRPPCWVAESHTAPSSRVLLSVKSGKFC